MKFITHEDDDDKTKMPLPILGPCPECLSAMLAVSNGSECSYCGYYMLGDDVDDEGLIDIS